MEATEQAVSRHGMSIELVQQLVSQCALCQMFRLGHVGAVQPIIQHLKVAKRRTAIGADTLNITPPDDLGNVVVLVIVIRATKLVYLHPLQNETSESLA